MARKIECSRNPWHLCLAAAGLFLASEVRAQAPDLLVHLQDDRWVAIVDPVTGSARRVYDARRGVASNVSVAPDGKHIALIEGGSESGSPYVNELVLLDQTGRLVHRIQRDVQRYDWCGAICLAYIEGAYREGGFGFTPKGAYVFDLSTGQERQLPGPTYPRDIRWAAFDSSLYVKNAGLEDGLGVFRFHVPTGTLSRTSYHDFHFSPSGRFYLQPASEASDRDRLFDRLSNREVPLPAATSVGLPTRWVFDAGDYLLFVKHERLPSTSTRLPRAIEKLIVDVRSGRVVQRVEGEIQPWSATPGVLPIIRGGRVNLLWRPRQ